MADTAIRSLFIALFALLVSSIEQHPVWLLDFRYFYHRLWIDYDSNPEVAGAKPSKCILNSLYVN